MRNLAIGALVLGALAAVAGSPRRGNNGRIDVTALARTVENEDDHVTAVELARWIHDRRQNLRIVDVRDSVEFEEYHIPRAERIPLDSLAKAPFESDETIVLYSGGGAHAAQAWVFLRALGYTRVYFLRGGISEWLDEVMNPVISASAPDSERVEFGRTAELSRYFGGVPRTGETLRLPLSTDHHSNTTPVSTKAAVAEVRRRGC